ncbi:uncharacterized protein N0V89_002060 [Didymosphaeria variabile]|uniref:Ankyrin n=1 Tax=Didymosphaeria variabile TaxID=1932322 RepID=A0A9W8XS00_9PLEO|nr:uncharacterized protein N0V89_002060 [Didymosphaeria variabile]KAJ4357484.1 hypothetical protein N0V89_002060 [Didymosphaeria variabile]
MEYHSDFIKEFLNHGVPVTMCSILPRMSHVGLLLTRDGFGLQQLDEDLLDCPEILKAIIKRSESQFKTEIASRDGTIPTIGSDLSLYEATTLLGWTRGCQILLDYGVPIRVLSGRTNLLHAAIRAKHLDVLRFWLSIRHDLDKNALEHVGYIETGLHVGQLDSVWVHTLMLALLKQRYRLQDLAEQHLPKDQLPSNPDKCLDACAGRIFDALVDRGVTVKPSLKPIGIGIHCNMWGPWQQEVADALFLTGFQDISAEDYRQDGIESISPLLTNLTEVQTSRHCIWKTLDMAQWFMLKGADFEEKWPGSDVTLSHCFGSTLGIHIIDAKDEIDLYLDELHLSFFTSDCSDSCLCGCSTSGCLFVAFFFKGFTTGDVGTYAHRWWRTPFRAMLHWARLSGPTPSTEFLDERSKNRWLVTEVIRLVTFFKLGLRHSGLPRGHISPIRYTEDEIKEIRQDDEYLLDQLERLMVEFDAKYDSLVSGDTLEDLDSFFDKIWRPRMEEVQRSLEKDDIELYGNGRRGLGVVMDRESEYDSEDSDYLSDGSETSTSGKGWGSDRDNVDFRWRLLEC